MTDITLCTNETCQQRSSCLRATTPPNPSYQSFDEFKPLDDGHCSMFLYQPGSDCEEQPKLEW